MPTNKPKISLNKTLLILLGIILACILTLNAKTFYSADSLSFPNQNRPVLLNKNVKLDLLKETSKSALSKIGEKVSSLK